VRASLATLLFAVLTLGPMKGLAAPVSVKVRTAAELVDACGKIGPEGGLITLAPGRYEIDRTIEFRGVNSLTIAGSGWSTVIAKRGKGDAFRFFRCNFCCIKDLLMLGEQGAGQGSGMVFVQCNCVTVDYCRICEFPESGMRFEQDPGKPECSSSSRVTNCHFIGNLGDQLYLHECNDFYITANQFGTHKGTPRTGCLLRRASAGTYTMNYHWGNTNAFRMLDSHYNRIENNRFEQSRETGIIIGSPTGDWCGYHIITGNTIHTNSENRKGAFPAVEAYHSNNITFCTNQVFSWDSDSTLHKHSLVLGKGCGHWIIKDNIFRHNTEKAIVADDGAGHVIKDNFGE
jgi:hypothetical protein